MEDTEIHKAIEKLASGFVVTEVSTDYALEDGELKVVKKKEVKKEVAPDMKAIMFLMEGDELLNMSDEELEREKEKLLNQIKESKKNDEER